MNTDCLTHCLQASERQQFESQGYLVGADEIPPDQLKRLSDACDRLQETKRQAGGGPHMPFSHGDIIGYDSVFVDKVDSAATIPKDWGILGWISPPKGARTPTRWHGLRPR